MGHERTNQNEQSRFPDDWELHFSALVQYVREYKKTPRLSVEAREPGICRTIPLGLWFSDVMRVWKSGELDEIYSKKLEQLINHECLDTECSLLKMSRTGEKIIDVRTHSSTSSSTPSVTKKRKKESILVEIMYDLRKEIKNDTNVLFHRTSGDAQIKCYVGKVLNEISHSDSISQNAESDAGNTPKRYRLAKYESNYKNEEEEVLFTLSECEDKRCLLDVEEHQIHLIGLNFEMSEQKKSSVSQSKLTAESKEAIEKFKHRLPIDWEYIMGF